MRWVFSGQIYSRSCMYDLLLSGGTRNYPALTIAANTSRLNLSYAQIDPAHLTTTACKKPNGLDHDWSRSWSVHCMYMLSVHYMYMTCRWSVFENTYQVPGIKKRFTWRKGHQARRGHCFEPRGLPLCRAPAPECSRCSSPAPCPEDTACLLDKTPTMTLPSAPTNTAS